jgi:hypothetical protein
MRRGIITAVCAASLAGICASSAVASPQITVSSVSILSNGDVAINLQETSGWYWVGNDATHSCTGSATVTGSDANTYTLSNPDMNDPLTGSNPDVLELLPDAFPTGVTAAPGPASGQVSCQIKHQVTIQKTRILKKAMRRRPGRYSARRVTAVYLPGGNCAGHGPDGSGGLILTCLFASEHVSYHFRIPRLAYHLRGHHRVTSGIERCRNASWNLHRSRRHRRRVSLSFAHGSRGGFSQCDIRSVGISYRVKQHYTVKQWVQRTVEATFETTIS